MTGQQEETYNLSNREKRQAFKKGLYWCGRCDGNLVRDWNRCEVCGSRNGVKRFKIADARRI